MPWLKHHYKRMGSIITQTVKKRILLHIHSSINTDGEVAETQLASAGYFYRLGDDWYLSYEEPGDTPADCTRTTIKVLPDGTAIVARSGSVSGRIVLQAGQRTLFTYYTPYGELELTAQGREIAAETDGDTGSLRLWYEIGTDQGKISENAITITFKIEESAN